MNSLVDLTETNKLLMDEWANHCIQTTKKELDKYPEVEIFEALNKVEIDIRKKMKQIKSEFCEKMYEKYLDLYNERIIDKTYFESMMKTISLLEDNNEN